MIKFYVSWIAVCAIIIFCGLMFGGCDIGDKEVQDIIKEVSK